MKKLVGKRENASAMRKQSAAILMGFFPIIDVPRSSFSLDLNCDKCSHPISIVCTEENDSGEIWIEGPDSCPECGHAIANSTITATLSQEQIEEHFGKY